MVEGLQVLTPFPPASPPPLSRPVWMIDKFRTFILFHFSLRSSPFVCIGRACKDTHTSTHTVRRCIPNAFAAELQCGWMDLRPALCVIWTWYMDREFVCLSRFFVSHLKTSLGGTISSSLISINIEPFESVHLCRGSGFYVVVLCHPLPQWLESTDSSKGFGPPKSIVIDKWDVAIDLWNGR